MKTTSRFQKFLINRGLLEAFTDNLKFKLSSNEYYGRVIETYEDLERCIPKKSLVMNAFKWGNTPQGYTFWDGVHDDWIESITNNIL